MVNNLDTTLRFLVTRTAPIATEWAAIIISIVPRGVPSLSQEVRNRAYASAASESQGIISTRIKNSLTASGRRLASGFPVTPRSNSACVIDEIHTLAIGTFRKCPLTITGSPLIIITAAQIKIGKWKIN